MSDNAGMDEAELREAGYVSVCSPDEVGGVMPKRVEVDGTGVLLCRDAESIFAVDEICPHENQSMRYGIIYEGTITCPHHQYRFRLADGESRGRRCAPARTYEVLVQHEAVWVRVPGR